MRETFEYWVMRLKSNKVHNPYVECLKYAIALYFDVFDVSIIEVVTRIERLGDINCFVNNRQYQFTFRQFLLYHATRGFDSGEIEPIDAVENNAVIKLADWLIGLPDNPALGLIEL